MVGFIYATDFLVFEWGLTESWVASWVMSQSIHHSPPTLTNSSVAWYDNNEAGHRRLYLINQVSSSSFCAIWDFHLVYIVVGCRIGYTPSAAPIGVATEPVLQLTRMAPSFTWHCLKPADWWDADSSFPIPLICCCHVLVSVVRLCWYMWAVLWLCDSLRPHICAIISFVIKR